MGRLSAYAENCKGQGIQPLSEPFQTWLKLKQKGDPLQLRCPWQTWDPEVVSALQHGSWGTKGSIVSVAWILRTLPVETRTTVEFSLELQPWVESAVDVRGTWLLQNRVLIHHQPRSKIRLAPNELSSDRLPLYAAPFSLYTHYSHSPTPYPREQVWCNYCISEGIFKTLFHMKSSSGKKMTELFNRSPTITKIILSLSSGREMVWSSEVLLGLVRSVPGILWTWGQVAKI